MAPYTIELPANQWFDLPQKHFHQATDGTPMPQETIVRLRQDGSTLSVEFECRQDPFWHTTTHREHNASLWEQEVFEVFIASGEETPVRYLELELNPNNALFVGWIDNPSGEGDANTLTMVPYGQAGIGHQVTGTTADSWRGQLHIPLALVKGDNNPQAAFRINFFRIILLKPQTDPHWTGNPENASFQCWRSTLSGGTPRFHRPSRFGTLLFS